MSQCGIQSYIESDINVAEDLDMEAQETFSHEHKVTKNAAVVFVFPSALVS